MGKRGPKLGSRHKPRAPNRRKMRILEAEAIKLVTKAIIEHQKERAYWEGVIAEQAEDIRLLQEEFARLTSPDPEPTVPLTKQDPPVEDSQ